MKVKNNIKVIKNLDRKIWRIMKIGMRFSFIFCLFASLVLLTYFKNYNPYTYNIGISLFESGLFFFCAFIICGFAFDKIIDDLM